MQIHIATLFPEICNIFLSESIIGRAQNAGTVSFFYHNIRDYSDNRHRKTDDMPFGGGHGMIMTAEPLARTFEAVSKQIGVRPYTVFLTAQGKRYNQQIAKQFSQLSHLLLFCGHYEGFDQRALEQFADCEISIGDFVLTGGEAVAVCIADSIVRLLPGVLSTKEAYQNESHYEEGYLEYPQYTRPAVWRGQEVPSVLLSGNHKLIEDWKRDNSGKVTNA